MGARMQYNFENGQSVFSFADGSLSWFPLLWIFAHPARLLLGIPFSATLMTILLAHEMGHYLMCKYYRVSATLPFFYPNPNADWDNGRVYPHPVADPVAGRAV